MKIQRRLLIPKRFGSLLVCLIAVLLIILLIVKPTNHAETRHDHPDARLRTRVYTAPLAEVKQQIQQSIGELKTYGRRWKLQPDKQRTSEADATIEVVVPVLVFSDDLVVTLHADTQSEQARTVVNVASRSRVGRGDLGENRRHILQLLDTLEKIFPSTD